MGSGNTTLIISNEEMNDIIKTIQALQDSDILLKGVTKTIKNETKEKKGGFLSMLLGTLGASLLGNLLTGKAILRAGSGNKKGKGIARTGTACPLFSSSKSNKKEWDFQCHLILSLILKYRNIIKMNQDLMVFFLEVIYLNIIPLKK